MQVGGVLDGSDDSAGDDRGRQRAEARELLRRVDLARREREHRVAVVRGVRGPYREREAVVRERGQAVRLRLREPEVGRNDADGRIA